MPVSGGDTINMHYILIIHTIYDRRTNARTNVIGLAPLVGSHNTMMKDKCVLIQHPPCTTPVQTPLQNPPTYNTRRSRICIPYQFVQNCHISDDCCHLLRKHRHDLWEPENVWTIHIGSSSQRSLSWTQHSSRASCRTLGG